MNDKTNEQLKRIALDRAFQKPETRHQALLELESRDMLDKELASILGSFKSSEEDEIFDARYSGGPNPDLTTDLSAPLLYSRRAIYLFSIFFSIIAGSLMLSRNLREKGKVAISIMVVFLSLLSLFLVGSLFSYLDSDLRIGVLINAGLAVGMTELFWNRYIGKDTKYRKRPIVVPLIIWLVIFAMIIYLMFISGTQ